MSKYDAERLQLIDAIPAADSVGCGGECPRFGRFEGHPIEKFEDVALWPSTAEALAEERVGLPYDAMAGEDGARYPYPTNQEQEIAGCLLRRALGICPEVSND